MNKYSWAMIILVLASFALAFYFNATLGATIATHWDAAGQPDGFGDKTTALFLIPAISLLIAAFLLYLPKFDPMKKNFPKYGKIMQKIGIVFLAFMLYIQLIMIYFNLGTEFSMTTALAPAFGMLFIAIGHFIRDTRRNWFLGIRTPWTLSSEKVWKKTHKLGAKLFTASGVLAIIGAFFGAYAFLFMIVPVLASAAALFAYSYIEYKKEKH